MTGGCLSLKRCLGATANNMLVNERRALPKTSANSLTLLQGSLRAQGALNDCQIRCHKQQGWKTGRNRKLTSKARLKDGASASAIAEGEASDARVGIGAWIGGGVKKCRTMLDSVYRGCPLANVGERQWAGGGAMRALKSGDGGKV